MHADARRMLADLGNIRRDEVAAPDEGGRDRDRRPQRVREREERMTRLTADERRANAGANEEDAGRASTLRAWNTAATFGGDDVAEQLENRFSGQGHRARLAHTVMNYNEYHEEDSRPTPSPHRLGGHNGHGGAAQGNAQPPSSLRDVLAMSSNQSNAPQAPRKRASSPRNSGTVRSDPRRRLQGPTSSAFAAPPAGATPSIVANLPAAAAPSIAPLAASPRSPAQAAPAPLAAAASPSRSTASTASLPPHLAARQKTQAQAAASSVPAAPPAPEPSAPVAPAPTPAPRTRTLAANSTADQPRGSRTSATAASVLTIESSHGASDRSNVLDDVWNNLITGNRTSTPTAGPAAAPSVARTPSPPLTAHQPAPSTSSTAVSSAATSTSTRTRPREPPARETLPSERWRNSSKSTTMKHIVWALGDAAEPQDTGASQWRNSDDRHFFDTARSNLAMDAILLMEFPLAQVTQYYFNIHGDRAWIRPHALDAINGRLTDVSSDPMLAELVEAARRLLDVEPGQSTAAVTPAPIDPPAPATSAVEHPGLPTPPSSTGNSPTGRRGMLNATYHDYDGNFQGVRQLTIDVPVQVNMTVLASEPGVDPTDEAAYAGIMAALSRRQQIREDIGLRLNKDGDWEV